MVAVFLVALPTAFLLHASQTVKTMPAFMYALMSALGIVFTLIGSYLGERIQMGPPPKSSE
jgi:drug/metabolite transporter (DMT)-like permease